MGPTFYVDKPNESAEIMVIQHGKLGFKQNGDQTMWVCIYIGSIKNADTMKVENDLNGYNQATVWILEQNEE
jgi:hypothetical protein